MTGSLRGPAADTLDAASLSQKPDIILVWKPERFSWQLTMLMHRFPDSGPFEGRMQVADLDYVASSVAAQTTITENYVGLPL